MNFHVATETTDASSDQDDHDITTMLRRAWHAFRLWRRRRSAHLATETTETLRLSWGEPHTHFPMAAKTTDTLGDRDDQDVTTMLGRAPHASSFGDLDDGRT